MITDWAAICQACLQPESQNVLINAQAFVIRYLNVHRLLHTAYCKPAKELQQYHPHSLLSFVMLFQPFSFP